MNAIKFIKCIYLIIQQLFIESPNPYPVLDTGYKELMKRYREILGGGSD